MRVLVQSHVTLVESHRAGGGGGHAARKKSFSQRLEASEMGGAATEEEEKGRRRRRLVAVLRQGVDARGAYKLESEVRRREARSTTMEEMLKRTPDLETPKYDVVAENQGGEVREYADFAVAGASAARAVDSWSDLSNSTTLLSTNLSFSFASTAF